QTSSWVITTSPRLQAACRAVRGCGEALASGALISSLLLWARSSSRRGRSLSTTAQSSQSGMEPLLSSAWAGRGATKTRCSYLARIHVSLSSLEASGVGFCRPWVQLSQTLFAMWFPIALSTWESSGDRSSRSRERTRDRWVPRFLWIPEHSIQISAPRLRLAHVGS
ncbi:hypothetical protein AALO_G00057590, partial [Alosa alosa]